MNFLNLTSAQANRKGQKILINMDLVTDIMSDKNGSSILFFGLESESAHQIVQESLDDIDTLIAILEDTATSKRAV